MFTSWYNIMSTKNIKINRNSRVCELLGVQKSSEL